VGGQLDDLVRLQRHEQTAATVVEGDAIRTAGQVQPTPRLDAGADGEHEQRVAARVGDVAPRRRNTVVHASEVRRADAGRRAAEEPAAPVAQLEHARAAEENDAAPAAQRRDVARAADGRRQLLHARRAAAREHRRDREQRRAERATPAAARHRHRHAGA
jgi:hypothetical protein